MDNEQIVNSIKNLCKNNKITITKLEETIGLSQGLISRWSKSDPSLSKIIDIADYFDVSLDEVVGYKRANLDNSEFIEKLIKQTDDGILTWGEDIIYHSELFPPSKASLNKSALERRTPPLNTKTYSTTINHTSIAIMANFSNNTYIDEPERIKLYIKPDFGSDYIDQKYTKKQLLPLWLRVLFSLKEKAPDEIKAKEFISSFLAENATKRQITLKYDMPLYDINNYTHKADIEHLIKFINTDEFKKMQEIFSNPDFQAAIQALNELKKYKKD